VLITAEELIRTTADSGYVENESDPVADASSHLEVVADHLTWWHTAAYLNLAFLFTWAMALLAVTVVVARNRPVLGVFCGVWGLVSVLGTAFHWAFYYLPLASLAQTDDRNMAAHAAAAYGDDVLLVIALLMFLVGTLLAVLMAGLGLWRAHALSWWGALGLLVWLGYVFAGPESRLAALLNLALLLPFVGVAQRLTTGTRKKASELEPVSARSTSASTT
jgi:hypothetical protein